MAPFALKLVYYYRHSESLKYVWKSTISCLRRKISSISRFIRMFKNSLCREKLSNLDAKGAKRSVKMRTTILYKTFFKNILFYMNGWPSEISSVHTYVIPGRFILIESVALWRGICNISDACACKAEKQALWAHQIL